MRSLLKILTCFTILDISLSDFIYKDFASTLTLQFNGVTDTSSCEDPKKDGKTPHPKDEYWYKKEHGANDDSVERIYPTFTDGIKAGSSEAPFSETESLFTSEEVMTDDAKTSVNIKRDTASVGHRDSFVPRQETKCPVRVRLTPSEPNKVGSMWYELGLPLYDGFQCGFTYQVSDHSRSCTKVKARNMLNHHESCRVHGGDGFAFVVHGDERGSKTLGTRAGESLGYGGIKNGIAVEFDTWYNPDTDDLFDDHITILSNGEGELKATKNQRIGGPRARPIADGLIHRAVVRYYPEVATELLSSFTATSELLRFIQDNDEKRRLGTFAVWVDGDFDGAGKPTHKPSLAIPINISKTLKLDQGVGWVGFTAATGRSWEKHDILSWYCCENPDENGCQVGEDFQKDYHSKSKSFGTIQTHSAVFNTNTDTNKEAPVELLKQMGNAHVLGSNDVDYGNMNGKKVLG